MARYGEEPHLHRAGGGEHQARLPLDRSLHPLQPAAHLEDAWSLGTLGLEDTKATPISDVWK